MTTGFAQAELIAVLAAVTGVEPRVMTIGAGASLPSGPFVSSHRSLQTGLRIWIENQTAHPVGFMEQLYTFADGDRETDGPLRRISISYLGLVREQAVAGEGKPEWHPWYEYFPWEDRRKTIPTIHSEITARLEKWANGSADLCSERRHRIDFAFGLKSQVWDDELVLQRYELMYEAGLVEESPNYGSFNAGRPMNGDHRRILATGLARLRAKIKYRPIAVELMPDCFTLHQLQRAVEALVGLPLHKSNFRRQIDQQNLIEETGDTTHETGGRPARLFRYRPAVLEARAMTGSRLPMANS